MAGLIYVGSETLHAQVEEAATDSGMQGEITDAEALVGDPDTVTAETSVFEELIDDLKKGGKIVVLQFILSIFALAYVLERLFVLKRSAIVPKGFAAKADDLWKKGEYNELLAMCKKDKSALSKVIAYITEHRNAPTADLSAAAGDVGSRELRRHLSKAYPIAVIANIEPLMGLMGTVKGMVEAFKIYAVAGGGGNIELLGASISVALMTTLVGLAIAIPLLLAYHWFKNRTNNYGMELEEQVTDLIGAWKMKTENV